MTIPNPKPRIMAAPLYFFAKTARSQLAPGGAISAALLARYGDLARTLADLTDLRRDASLAELTGPGPGGQSGCLLCALPVDQEPPPRLHYAPDFQTWKPIGDGSLWVGVDNEHPIVAADLRRKKTFQGYEVELAGQQWTVPVIRDPEGGTGLPRDFIYGDGGHVEQRIKAAYLSVWEKFSRAVWLFFDPEGPWPLRMDLAEGTDLCLEALALNYRVGRIEQNLLGLIDSETWYMVLAAAVDYPTYRDLAQAVEGQKKTKLQESQNRSTISREIAPPAASTATSPGPPADCPATDPAAVNCAPSPKESEDSNPPIPNP